MSDEQHFPGPLMGILLSFGAVFATGAVIVLLATPDEPIPLGVLGVGHALGMGLVASLAARAVPEPREVRVGLRGFDRSWVPWIALLIPLVVVVSELDNWAGLWIPQPEAEEAAEIVAERLALGTWLGLLETAIVFVGIAPVVEEFLYRGVVQQGLIAHLGRAGGVVLTAVLSSFAHIQLGTSPANAAAALVLTLPLSFTLSALRLATGSLLAPMLLHAATNAVGLLGLALSEQLPIPGFNAPGDHTPFPLLVASVAASGFALVRVVRAARTAPATPPLPDATEQDRDGADWPG